jgi:hypothetical protein
MGRTPTRRIRDRLAAGERAYGVIVQFPNPESVETAGYTGYDFAWLDAEHGPMDLSTLADLIRAAEAVGIDRVVHRRRVWLVPRQERVHPDQIRAHHSAAPCPWRQRGCLRLVHPPSRTSRAPVM